MQLWATHATKKIFLDVFQRTKAIEVSNTETKNGQDLYFTVPFVGQLHCCGQFRNKYAGAGIFGLSRDQISFLTVRRHIHLAQGGIFYKNSCPHLLDGWMVAYSHAELKCKVCPIIIIFSPKHEKIICLEWWLHINGPKKARFLCLPFKRHLAMQ